MIAAAYAYAVLILLGCCAYALSVLPGHARLTCLGRTLAIRGPHRLGPATHPRRQGRAAAPAPGAARGVPARAGHPPHPRPAPRRGAARPGRDARVHRRRRALEVPGTAREEQDVNERFLAICLFAFAWIALGIPGAAAFTAIRGRGDRLTAVGTVVFLFTAAVLANAGADLWSSA
jgi:hypothetical protein